jgi:hypothetical protein
MSRGPGRLERLIVEHLSRPATVGMLCRIAYPDASKILKKHRVAVLEVLHRLERRPPRPGGSRNWMAAKNKDGIWYRHLILGDEASMPHSRIIQERSPPGIYQTDHSGG